MVAHVKKTQEAEGQNKPGSAEYDFDDHDAAENQRRAAGTSNSGLASAATASSDATAAASSDATAAVTAAGKKQRKANLVVLTRPASRVQQSESADTSTTGIHRRSSHQSQFCFLIFPASYEHVDSDAVAGNHSKRTAPGNSSQDQIQVSSGTYDGLSSLKLDPNTMVVQGILAALKEQTNAQKEQTILLKTLVSDTQRMKGTLRMPFGGSGVTPIC